MMEILRHSLKNEKSGTKRPAEGEKHLRNAVAHY